MQTAIIIGAGPAGLTAALEFCRHSAIRPIVLETSGVVGGLSGTHCHNGNRIDIGGHRFFSKSDRVMEWWTSILPLAEEAVGARIQYRNASRTVAGVAPREAGGDPDAVMLVRSRKSRIYFGGAFFDYPISLSPGTLRRLGWLRTLRVVASYLRAQLFPRRPEISLEDFVINRFGDELYRTFFQSYTEKVWGVPCSQIAAAWGAQRMKGLSLRKAAAHFLRGRRRSLDFRQKETETSLVEQFLYPKRGPGQLWERVAELVKESGGEVRLGWRVMRLHGTPGSDGAQRITCVEARTPEGETVSIAGDYFLSTMPVRDLLRGLEANVPEEIRAIAEGLQYRDFLTVGLLVDRLLITEEDGSQVRDNWIYLHEPGVLAGRLQIFNNWSPAMVADPSKVWMGLEYFCSATDALWKMSDDEIARLAVAEASRLGILDPGAVRDHCVVRAPRAYPAYTGSYERFDEIIRYMERFENLFLAGRNGMHRYNNQDHSMLTAMVAVENILAGITAKQGLWDVNTEMEYHETKSAEAEQLRV